MKLSLLVLCFLISVVVCKKGCEEPCRCDQHGLDFSDISDQISNVNITVREEEKDKYIYWIAPCKGTDCQSGGTDTSGPDAGCQAVLTQKGTIYSLGKVSSVEWDVSSKTDFSVIYGDGGGDDDGLTRRVRVNFHVVTNVSAPTVKFDREDKDPNNGAYHDYVFVVYLTPSEADIKKASIVGLAGLIIIIICLLGVLTYFIIGSVIMYKVKGARGAEVIPQYEFWKSLPGLIKDGFLFTISPCRTKFGKGYQAL